LPVRTPLGVLLARSPHRRKLRGTACGDTWFPLVL